MGQGECPKENWSVVTRTDRCQEQMLGRDQQKIFIILIKSMIMKNHNHVYETVDPRFVKAVSGRYFLSFLPLACSASVALAPFLHHQACFHLSAFLLTLPSAQIPLLQSLHKRSLALWLSYVFIKKFLLNHLIKIACPHYPCVYQELDEYGLWFCPSHSHAPCLWLLSHDNSTAEQFKLITQPTNSKIFIIWHFTGEKSRFVVCNFIFLYFSLGQLSQHVIVHGHMFIFILSLEWKLHDNRNLYFQSLEQSLGTQ